MTIQEALKRAEELEQQGCITPTALALVTLAKEWYKANLGAQEAVYGPFPVKGNQGFYYDDWEEKDGGWDYPIKKA